ncbi:hypothetical protein EYF80_041338 [Liparis tanakae]|uniref:Uncharacterized protein n=1 Tax=Liparis tanakae TaxID=230148 RepID=A0A4Z2G6P7_9TELE|nr:hypothetical protein EYF80_041338 [Liparis tanakae]
MQQPPGAMDAWHPAHQPIVETFKQSNHVGRRRDKTPGRKDARQRARPGNKGPDVFLMDSSQMKSTACQLDIIHPLILQLP